jgi:predicted nucleic acid-binding protein
MEQPQFLMDTNAVIDFLGNKLPISGMKFLSGVVDAIPNVSVVTKIELLGFNASEENYKILSNFINDATVLDLSNKVVEKTIEIRKKHKTKLPDAIIAATALVNDLALISRNISDFKNIEGLKILDPHGV